MKKTAFILFLTTICSLSTWAIEISRMEPAFWWVGMKNPELQLLIQGKDIGNSKVEFNYPGVKLQEVIKVENPNYLFLYLSISDEAKPGKISFRFIDGKKSITRELELKPRASSLGAQGFTPADVMYLIMPDRFANGNTENDNWDKDAVDRNEPFGRHRGDFEGINEHLDYISDLGVTTIWLNPVLENKMPRGSYHGYAITDFYKVDPRFGTNDDYCRLIENVHNKGMKVVMDMIFNHCGSHHWWMNDFPTSDWLNHQDGFVPTSHNLYTVMDVHAPQSEIDGTVNGWFVPDMPDMNQRNRHLATYLIQNSIWWIEYARIDGIRHDTHPYVDFDFLSNWCKAIENEYPDFNIVGESWYINPSPLSWWQRNSKLNKEQTNLKTTMDFSLMNACERAFDIQSKEHNPLKQIYEVIAQDFLYEDLENILIFLDNHDTSRFPKAGETGLERYKQALALLLTMRGIPQIYYGTEILMAGEKRDGDGNLRKDFPGGWKGDPINAFSKEGRTNIQNEAWNYMQHLLKWRKGNKAIAEGKLIHYAPDYQTECYVYARIHNESIVLVVLNGSEKEQSLPTAKYNEVIGNHASGKDIISGKNIELSNNSIIKIAPKGVMIIELN